MCVTHPPVCTCVCVTHPSQVQHILQHEADPGRGLPLLYDLLHLIEVLVHTRLWRQTTAGNYTFISINSQILIPSLITCVCVCVCLYLGLLKVQVLADGGQQPAQALQRLLVVVFQQLHDAVVHDDLREHLELEQLADELDVAQRAPPGLVFGLLQLVDEPLLLLLLPDRERETVGLYLYLQKLWDIKSDARASFKRASVTVPRTRPPAPSASSRRSRRRLCPSQTPSGIGLAAACGNSQ